MNITIPWEFVKIAAYVPGSGMEYLMGMTQVRKPVQLSNKDPKNLSHMMATMPPLLFIPTYYILERLLIFVKFGNIGLMEIFL